MQTSEFQYRSIQELNTSIKSPWHSHAECSSAFSALKSHPNTFPTRLMHLIRGLNVLYQPLTSTADRHAYTLERVPKMSDHER